MALRPIDVSGFTKITAPGSTGAASQLMWIALEKLVVDDAYQRDFTGESRTKIRAIAENFDWDFFAPVVAAPVEGGLFAIVDGQHRAHAAALIGRESVPCCVILAEPRKQARAFDAINGHVTRVTKLQRFKAQCAAGNAEALRTRALIERAGCNLRNTTGGRQRMHAKPADLFCIDVIKRAMAKHGLAVAELALRCVLASASETSGFFRAGIVAATATVLGDHREWRGAQIIAAFETLHLLEAHDAARAEAHRRPGVRAGDLLEAAILDHVTACFGKGAAA